MTTRATVAGLMLVLGASFASAATITVNTTTDELNADGDCSLREAIRAANLHAAVDACTAGSGTDTIIVPAGTYALTLAGASEDNGVSGDLDVRSSLTLQGAGAGSTIIDATGLGERALEVKPPVAVMPGPIHITVDIRGLTLTGGTDGGGGGLFIDETPEGPPGMGYSHPTVTIEDCVIEANTAGFGGGIRTQHPDGIGVVTIRRTSIRNNTSTSSGGAGIDSFSTFVMEDSTVSGNTANAAGGVGGIYENRALTVRRSTIADNHSAGGIGGIFAVNDTLSLENVTISGNTATGTQQGVSVGGVAVGDSANGADVTIHFSTITNNTGAQTGGVQVGTYMGFPPVPVARLGETIVAGNAGASSADVKGPFTSLDYNLIGDGAMSTGFTGANDQVGTTATPIDPLLGSLGPNGGFTDTHPLGLGSPAVDAAACGGVAEDQRGITRPVGASCDVGAYEGSVLLPCSEALLGGCATAAKHLLQIKDLSPDTKDMLSWSFTKGTAAANQSDFGNPVAGGNEYRFCVYDRSGGARSLALEIHVPGGAMCGTKPCWSAIGTKGYKYVDPAAATVGVKKIKLKGGTAGVPLVMLQGKGLALPLPAPVSGSRYFDADPAVTVQLIETSTGNCWESTFVEATNGLTNTATQYTAKIKPY
jgi:CSLREA domain-containing protein